MKKLIDEKGRLFGKVSVVDLGVILLLVFIIAGAYLQLVVLEPTGMGAQEIPIRYTLEVSGVRDWTIDNLRVGDALFAREEPMGTIVSMEYGPHNTLTISGDGEIWWSEVPDRYVLHLEIEASAIVVDGRYLVFRTTPLAVSNGSPSFHTKFAQFSGRVLEIAPIEQDDA